MVPWLCGSTGLRQLTEANMVFSCGRFPLEQNSSSKPEQVIEVDVS